jgi:carboxymethylenebutenolidase
MTAPDEVRAEAVALYDRFTHVTHDRRAFMAEMTRLAGSVAAANLLVAEIAGTPAAAAVVAEGDARLAAETISWPAADDRTTAGYHVRPRQSATLGAVMVVHENRGLTLHIRDVARRLALAGFVVLAPDFLSVSGGTPTDEDRARDMIGTLDLANATADGLATLTWLEQHSSVNGKRSKAGAVGFCWGGAMVNRLAATGSSALAAGVAYYGPAPAPAEASRVRAPLLLHYAGLDKRVDATGEPWVAALKAARKNVTTYRYEGANHAFNNDTSRQRYDPAAAELAWSRTIAFLQEHLA